MAAGILKHKPLSGLNREFCNALEAITDPLLRTKLQPVIDAVKASTKQMKDDVRFMNIVIKLLFDYPEVIGHRQSNLLKALLLTLTCEQDLEHSVKLRK